MNISEHQTLEMHNVLSYRAKMSQQELMAKSQQIESIVQTSGAKRSAPAVTTTFAVEPGNIMDVELLIPLDRKIQVPAGFTWKEDFLLTNALVIRHIGNPAKLSATVSELNTYIMANKLVPISTGYNVTVKEAKTPLEIDEMIVDIYVSISPNKL